MRQGRAIYAGAPRLDPLFVEAIGELDDPSLPIAETYRRLRGTAEQLGIPRPSYESVRLQVKIARRASTRRRAKRELALALSLRARHLEALRELASEP